MNKHNNDLDFLPLKSNIVYEVSRVANITSIFFNQKCPWYYIIVLRGWYNTYNNKSSPTEYHMFILSQPSMLSKFSLPFMPVTKTSMLKNNPKCLCYMYPRTPWYPTSLLSHTIPHKSSVFHTTILHQNPSLYLSNPQIQTRMNKPRSSFYALCAQQ